ncbi:MAG: M10 family metallopeptidase C-terminal domain-containing protein [Bauldia sp.]|nr:M10 family metallopeptidase C-terminal domain-containing protein [Bauldia sp.]
MAKRLERSVDWGTRLHGPTISYAFADKGEKIASPMGKIASVGLNHYEKSQFKLAFELYASFADLKFQRVKHAGSADLVIATYRDDSTTLGAMEPPGWGTARGHGVFNHDGIGWDEDQPGAGALEQGGFGFITVIHELGHGLGLAHPHDRGGDSTLFPGVSSSSDLGKFALNQGVWTVMSYNDGWQTNPEGMPPEYAAYGFEGTPMAIDIAVLQDKYGANEEFHRGANTYRLPTANDVGTYYSCIWDAGGRDKIVAPGDVGATINLQAATLKAEPGGGGFVSSVDGILGGFTIAHRVTIENARGGGGDDAITGNASSNRLAGRAGDDVVDGRGAADTLRGGADADVLHGGRGADRLDGGTGYDILSGGRGADRLDGGSGGGSLTGGSGADTFLFGSPPGDGGVTTVTDFAPRHDVIALSAAGFAALGGSGSLRAASFAAGTSAVDASDRIIYDPASGALRYDPDGIGDAPATTFALLTPGLHLNHAHFVIVG